MHITTKQLDYYCFCELNIALYVGLLFCILLIAGESFRRIPLHYSLAFWCVVPPLLFPTWIQHSWDWFLWTKTISLIPIAIIWCSIVRIGTDEHWTKWGTFLLLSTNIAEAVTKDIVSKRGRETWLNAISGILLIVSELPTLDTIRISDDERRDFLWTLGQPWIVAYTVWNLMFIVFNYPYSLARHSAVLLAPLVLISRSGWDTWLQARGYTLAFYFMIRCTIYTRLLLLTNVRIRHSVDQARILQVLSFAGVATLLAINNFMFQSININGIYKQNSP